MEFRAHCPLCQGGLDVRGSAREGVTRPWEPVAPGKSKVVLGSPLVGCGSSQEPTASPRATPVPVSLREASPSSSLDVLVDAGVHLPCLSLNLCP